MSNSQFVMLIVIAFFWILIGFAGRALAKKKNRNQRLWFINCILSGLFGLLFIACSTKLEVDEETETKETDTLGWIIFCISLVMFGLSIYYGCLEEKAYYDRLYYNYYMG